jgi:hypothetical protein
MYLRPAMVFCTTRSVNYVAQHMDIPFQPIGASPQFVKTARVDWYRMGNYLHVTHTFAAQEISRYFMETTGKCVFTGARHWFVYLGRTQSIPPDIIFRNNLF